MNVFLFFKLQKKRWNFMLLKCLLFFFLNIYFLDDFSQFFHVNGFKTKQNQKWRSVQPILKPLCSHSSALKHIVALPSLSSFSFQERKTVWDTFMPQKCYEWSIWLSLQCITRGTWLCLKCLKTNTLCVCGVWTWKVLKFEPLGWASYHKQKYLLDSADINV